MCGVDISPEDVLGDIGCGRCGCDKHAQAAGGTLALRIASENRGNKVSSNIEGYPSSTISLVESWWNTLGRVKLVQDNLCHPGALMNCFAVFELRDALTRTEIQAGLGHNSDRRSR